MFIRIRCKVFRLYTLFYYRLCTARRNGCFFMKEFYEISVLIDFYGQMLTDKQYEILDLHYNNDYSFGEIAELFSISRQGVYDNIKRGKKVLVQMEEKLRLIEKFDVQRNKISEMLEIVKLIDLDKLDTYTKDKIICLERNISLIVENME